MTTLLRLSPLLATSKQITLNRLSPLITSRLIHSSPFSLLDTERSTSSSSSSSSASSYPPIPLPPSARKRPPSSSTPTSTTTSTATASTTSTPPPTRKRITSVGELPSTFGRNQIISVPDEVRAELEEVMRDFKAPVRFAFAYGSGVFRQNGYNPEDKPLLDFVFAVSHPSHWHAVNMQQNPTHYSLPMRLLGSDAVAWMQEKGLGANVWFNVEVEVKGKILKYGCISVDSLCRDLLDWETLYISGRTQKPVRILVDDARVRLANQVNLASALRTSLLLLPEEFNELELFETIAGLSYRGDFRMKVGENPLKVRNIVGAQLDSFRSLYGGLLKSFWKTLYVIGEKSIDGRNVRIIRQDRSIVQRGLIASKLPVGLKGKVLAHYERKFNLSTALGTAKVVEQKIEKPVDQSELWNQIVEDPEFQTMLDKSLAQIVARPTFNQSLKGIISAGPLKSLRYIGPKLRKKWFPRAPSAPVIQDK